MNLRVQNSTQLPLVVDLDGTLISADLLWESVFMLIKQNPLYLFVLPIWLWRGKAHLKTEIAARVTIDAQGLPYREDFLAFLQAEKANGREIVLVTAAAEPFAQAIAAHIGLFDAVYSSSADTNLAAHRKALLLTETYGPKGFDYAGNDRADIPVFEVANRAIVVAPDGAADKFQRQTNSQRFDGSAATWKTYAKMLRVHQWLKNLLVFVPAVLAHEIFEPTVFLTSLAGFVAFCAAASSFYIINDLLDLPLDRRHPTKRNRPFANGIVSIPFGLTVSAALLAIVVGISFFLPPLFAAVIGIYVLTTAAYSFAIKRMLLIDVLCLAGLYSLRLLAGKAAANLPPSFWLIAFGLFFFLSLALVKRYVELQSSKVDDRDRVAGRGYRPEDLQIVGQSGLSAAFAAALVLSLYIQSEVVSDLYSEPWLIWPLVPIVLYINVRIWILAHRREMHEDPVVFIATDWRSQLVVGFGALLMLVGTVM
ncbi:UbiA family prenyltransferase [Devosia psychrophila]|uniref:4-hydroxybenzoate polyprenyltransferase n=1 Tax=Devosia psychrophila TaxID=728005 RepID=A0A0F5PYR9_9HYPH|nr:UbiA family prenyltransferase [Devosia psychrophila]KKC33817.1 UbiA prenyltransferase [Devosia psychrophila]SFD37884.1 4-hydroxybenzoate polyprenyltransferase [Devosia psychrophila]